MLNCRSIPQDQWEQARQALVFYFSRRHGRVNAEDLAQETLTAFWIREDLQFEAEAQFLRVCFGFASRISKQGYRVAQKHAGEYLEAAHAQRVPRAAGLTGAEVRVFADEVCRKAEAELTPKEWELVQALMDSDRSDLPSRFAAGNANNFRVRLHRIRKKLSRVANYDGWREGEKKV